MSFRNFEHPLLLTKLPLCLIKHCPMTTLWRSGSIVPPVLTWALGEIDWSASYSGRTTLEQRAYTSGIGCWVRRRGPLNAVYWTQKSASYETSSKALQFVLCRVVYLYQNTNFPFRSPKAIKQCHVPVTNAYIRLYIFQSNFNSIHIAIG